MRILGLNITRAKALSGQLQTVDSRTGGWWPIIRESFSGAWQQNVEVQLENVLTYASVYACVTLISSDIGKLRVKLVKERDGIWTETTSDAFSPFLRKPNRFQNRIKFYEQWVASKLIHGNTYVLKERDNRNVVVAAYVLNPLSVRVLVAPNGDVFYELNRDHLSGLEKERLIVPASEIIHDVMVPLYHPLVGVSPISACGLAAVQGLNIQNNMTLFFGSGSNPSGILTAPGEISQPDADAIKSYWSTGFSGANAGKVAVISGGMKYEQMTMSAVDSQLIEQLKWTAENVCTAFHVPPYMIGVGPPPNYNNIEALNQQYYSQTLQTLIECIELLLDEGLGLDKTEEKYGTELALDDLLRMDTPTRVKSAHDSIKAGMTINEARRIYYGLGSVVGGDSVLVQQQEFSIEAIAKRDASDDPFGTAKAQLALPPASGVDDPEDELTDDDAEKAIADLMRQEMGVLTA